MDGNLGKRFVLLTVLVLIGSLVLSIPGKPPAKMWITTGEVTLSAVFLLCLGIYDLVRRVPWRPSIPLVWFTLAIGLGCFSMGLGTMARTWGLRLAQLPIAQVSQWFGAGMFFLLAGGIGFGLYSCQKARISSQG
jgi:hypothetical protein